MAFCMLSCRVLTALRKFNGLTPTIRQFEARRFLLRSADWSDVRLRCPSPFQDGGTLKCPTILWPGARGVNQLRVSSGWHSLAKYGRAQLGRITLSSAGGVGELS